MTHDGYIRRGWFWRGRKEVFACLRCGSLILDADRDTHDEWHGRVEKHMRHPSPRNPYEKVR